MRVKCFVQEQTHWPSRVSNPDLWTRSPVHWPLCHRILLIYKLIRKKHIPYQRYCTQPLVHLWWWALVVILIAKEQIQSLENWPSINTNWLTVHQKLPKCIQIHLTVTSFFNCKTFYISVKFLLSITYVPLRGLGLSLPPDPIITPSKADKYPLLVHTTQVNSAFSTHWLASSKVISKYQFCSPLSSWRDKSMWLELNFKIQAKHKKLV